MDSKRLHIILIVTLALLGAALLASVRGANMLLERQSKTLVNLKAESKATSNQQVQLIKDKQDVATYDSLNKIAKTVVPQDKDQAQAVREIVNLAAQSGIPKLTSIAFPPSTLGGPKVKTGSGITQVTPVKGIPGVLSLQITVTQANTDLVPYGSFTAFLSRLEQNRRTAQVSSINVQPDPKNPNMVAFTLIIDEFIKP